ASLRGGVEEFETVPFIHLRESPLYGWNRVLKRSFDLVFGALALALAGPAMLAIAVALKLTSSGPVLFHQERMGVDGRRFRMLKFRTMQVDAEAKTGPIWARADDPRRTSLGSFLRRWSLDELPQFINVLRGEMSLVGPRPERPSFVEDFRRRVPGYMLRHKVKAGITGWAQINGWRGNTSIEKRIEYDLYYIERWSIGFDLTILMPTLWRFRHRHGDRRQVSAEVHARARLLQHLHDAGRRGGDDADQRAAAAGPARSRDALAGAGVAGRRRRPRPHLRARRLAGLRGRRARRH